MLLSSSSSAMAHHHLLPYLAIIWLTFLANSLPAFVMSRNGCGDTKGCLFKPPGCDPRLDCSIALVFHVSAPNKLTVQLMAQALIPAPPLQYVAIGFSEDAQMGHDMVAECILSPESQDTEVEVFASYNVPDGRSNSRTQLNETEWPLLFDSVEGTVEDRRLYCSFNIALRPQFAKRNVWDLDKKMWIMGATGSAQPDEINAHDMAVGSHYFPVMSSRAIDPSRVGHSFPLPAHFNGSAAAVEAIVAKDNGTKQRNNGTTTATTTASSTGTAALVPTGAVLLGLLVLLLTMS